MDWQSIRNDFIITKKVTYLNNAAYTPLPIQTINAIKDFFYEYSEIGPDAYGYYDEILNMMQNIRKELAEILDCSPNEIIFTESATQGINFAALLTRLRKGDEVIIRDGEHEHPSNFLPWLHFSKINGFKLRRLNIDEKGFFDLNELEKMINENTKLIAITHALFNTGAIMPLEEVGKIAKEKGILFFVDAAQTVGCLPLSVKELNCDFLAFTAAKWLCGPLGVGALYIRERVAKELEPITIGPDSVKSFSNNDYELNELPTAHQEGFRNFAGVYGFGESIRYVKKIGVEKIRKRNMELADLVIEKLKSINRVKFYNPDSREKRISIISLNINKLKAEEVVKRLNEKKIVVANRKVFEKEIVRVSPHFYNNEEEVESLIKEVKNLINS